MEKTTLSTGGHDSIGPRETMGGGGESDFTPRQVTIKAFPMQLSVHKREGGRWSPLKLPAGKKTIRVGSMQADSDIAVRGQDVDQCHVIFEPVKDKWQIIECGKASLLKVNGIQRRQTAIPVGGCACLEIGQVALVLQNLGDKNVPAHEESKANGFTVSLPGGGKSIPFTSTAMIGGDTSCAIQAKGESFFGFLTSHASRPYIYPLAEDKIKIDGAPVTGAQYLRDKANIAVGDIVFRVELPEGLMSDPSDSLPPKVDMRLRLWFIDEAGNIAEKYQLPGPGKSIFIGRGAECNLKIEGTSVSRKHSQMIMYDSSVMVLDCYSTNGTFVNGMKIAKKTVRPGDIIQFGDLAFMLVFAE